MYDVCVRCVSAVHMRAWVCHVHVLVCMHACMCMYVYVSLSPHTLWASEEMGKGPMR